jgi:hypothetical protein
MSNLKNVDLISSDNESISEHQALRRKDASSFYLYNIALLKGTQWQCDLSLNCNSHNGKKVQHELKKGNSAVTLHIRERTERDLCLDNAFSTPP